jgi:hypothetical protein
LAGLVPFACRGEESLVYTPAGLDEFRGLRIWGVQNATERSDWKMHWMVKTLHKLVDGESGAGESWEEVSFEAPWLEGAGTVQKYVFGTKEVWEIADSTSSTWTQRGLRYKHHNCWTDVMKFGVLGRRVTSWMLEGANPHVDVVGELSYSLILRRPPCRCLRGRSASAEPVPWENAETKACKARRLGLWASPEGIVGANIPWKDGCAPAHGKSILVGDEIVAWEERGGSVHLQLRRGRHLTWMPTDHRSTFEGAICTTSEADFHKWFPQFEDANQNCFQRRCLGNFDVATQWSDAKCIDFSKRTGSVDGMEAESTAAETEEDAHVAPVDARLRAQADRDRRVFLSSRFCLSMLCQGALELLLQEYKCMPPEGADFHTKTEALREAAKNRLVYEEFHTEPWRWVNRIRRALRDARQPWLQLSALNDRLGLDKAGVPVTRKRLAQCEESDLFCFMDTRGSTAADGKRKAHKELFVGLASECAKWYPEQYKLWVRPEKSQPGGARFCEICAASEKRKPLASTHDARFCKFAPKPKP